jgi:cell division protein FtsL
MSTIVLFVLLGLSVVALSIVNQRRRSRALAVRSQQQQEDRAQVDLVMARLDAMAKLLEDDSLGADEMMASFDLIAADLAAHDPKGCIRR